MSGAGIKRWLAAPISLAVLIAGCGSGGQTATAPLPSSTLEATLADHDGNGTLERAPGEPLLERTELAPAAPLGRPLTSFAQITDAHLRDEESPARAPLLDRLGQTLNSAFRPQEALSPQVLDAAVEAVNATRPDAVVVTGDLIDSDQRNELQMALAILNGGVVDPNSGGAGYSGPQDEDNPDPFFYRPDIDAPRHPGLLDAAQLSFDSPGLTAPWYPVAGNHDLLVEGEVPPTPALDRLATGSKMLSELDPSFKLPPGADHLSPGLVNRVLAGGLPGRTDTVAADPGRRHLPANRVIRRLADASAAPGEAAGSGRLDYSFDLGSSVRAIVLDLVDRTGGSAGAVSPGQADWLASELRGAGRRWVLVFSHQPLESSAGAQPILSLLDKDPKVVATISGHTHRNAIEPRRTPAGGYWEISTASLTDFPQQTRAFRLVETGGGGVALQSWMLNTASEPLANIARALAFLDPQGGRPQDASGNPDDRNVTLYR